MTRRAPRRALVLLAAAAVSPSALSQGDPPAPPNGCGLTCPNSGVCQKGIADFPSSLDTTAAGDPIPFLLKKNNTNGEYCWCRDNFTGFDCSHPYEYCWEKSNSDGVDDGFACFHGGQCVRGDPTDQFDWGCDCSTAKTGGGFKVGLFAGPHCEYEADIECLDNNINVVGFCVNGGVCISGKTNQDEVCDCPPEWTGPHCEYLKTDEGADASVGVGEEFETPPVAPEGCDLDCQNDGVCQFGSASFRSNLETTAGGFPIPFLTQIDDGNGQYCWCPDGYTGYDCSHRYEYCWELPDGDGDWGDGFACFNGAQCVQNDPADQFGWGCDCSTATATGGFLKGLFAGLHCEFKADMECLDKEINVVGFCVNSACIQGETDQENMCDCEDNWTGPHCEYYDPKETPKTETEDENTDTVQDANRPQPPADCSLECENNGACQKGFVDFPSSLDTTIAGEPIPFLQETSDGNEQFCWCPDGYTGYDCSHPYEYCWGEPNSGGTGTDGFACFHGSTCTNVSPDKGNPEMDQWVCDCSTANFYGSGYGLFAGRHCEFRARDICSVRGGTEPVGFCVNGGRCIPGVTSQIEMCDCPPEWTGSHCEFLKTSDTETGTVDDSRPEPPAGCSLQCANEGVCQIGSANFPGNLDTEAKGEPILFLQQTSDANGEYCWCPEGFTGFDCSHQYDYCWEKPDTDGAWGDGFACFHGGSCDEVTVDIGQSELDKWLCDCASANINGFENGLFAGRHCEFRATDVCTIPGQEKWAGFCVNGGTCKPGETEQYNMCECSPEWNGPHCEYVKTKSSEPGTGTETQQNEKPSPPDGCSLGCENGGVCQKGSADFDFLTSSDYLAPVEFLLQTSDVNGEHCWCPEGWTGYKCEHKYEVCWEGPEINGKKGDSFACFHGGSCSNDSGDLKDVSAWSCDCSDAHFKGADTGMFAGLQCESRATEECLSNDLTASIGFCVNGGRCKRGESDQENMCDCASGWLGPHCEIPSQGKPDPDPDCFLECDHGGVCKKGSSNFSSLVHQSSAPQSRIPFLDLVTRNGEYCWCPDGWTGLQCHHRYEYCDQDEDFACFHSGKCTNLGGWGELGVQWACDCSTAQSEGEHLGLFAGTRCEHVVTDECEVANKDGLSEKQWFCVNGGNCQKGETNPYKICQCSDGWTGPHCEYEISSSAAEEHQHKKCVLGCKNGGKCVFGVKDYGDHAKNNEAKELPWLEKDHEDGMHCVCPDGYTGLLCQVPAEKCGERLWCYNGSECKKTKLEDGTLKKYCECAEAATKQSSFAGIGCQHESSVFCNPDSNMLQKMSFCTNGGTCFESGEGHIGCDCTDDWSGQHCQYHKTEDEQFSNPKECRLECKNGGVCAAGTKDYGRAGKFPLSFLGEEHTNFEHCVCPEGYTGLNCAIRLDVCSDKHVCAYGSHCEVRGTTDSGDKVFGCNCDGARNENGDSVAGKYCHHEATEYCVFGGSSGAHSFCTNGGKCVGQIARNQQHPGCICPPDWTGEHCEFRQKSVNAPFSKENHETASTKQAAILFSVMVALIALIILAAVVLTRKFATVEALEREEQKKQKGMPNPSSGDTFDAEGDKGHGEETEDGRMNDVDIL